MLNEIWNIFCELSPWLLLGMLLSGVLHVLLPPKLIRRRFRGFGGVTTAVVLGIPLPLCSCGVIPAGIGLKNDGASDGAAVGFLITTPQTGVDSILVAVSFFGWPFAIFKMLTALITGLLGGWLTELSGPRSENTPHATNDSEPLRTRPPFRELFTHGLEILRSIWVWLIVGVVLSAVITQIVPESWIASVAGYGTLTAMLLALTFSVPLYVCATASVPIAAALVQSGFPPAAAFVFLVAGPATNVTTIAAIVGRFGWRIFSIYFLTIVIGSLAGGYLFESWFGLQVVGIAEHQHQHHQTWWAVASAVALIGLIGWTAWQDIGRRLRKSTVSHADVASATQVIRVGGLHCQSCVQRLESALRKSAQIGSAIVDLKAGLATVRGSLARPLIEQIIKECGYQTGESSPKEN